DLYPEGGARRDSAFSIYYMGINVGAFFGPLICGYLGETINWHLGFSAAGIGMVVGVIQYQLGARHLGTAGLLKNDPPSPAAGAQARRALFRSLEAALGLILIVAVLQSIGAIHLRLLAVVDYTGIIIAAVAAAFLLFVVLFG